MSVAFEDPTYLESVYAALFALLQAAALPNGIAFQTMQRTALVPSVIPPASQPALLLLPGPIRVEQTKFSLPRWIFTAVAVVYLRGDAQQINQVPLPSATVNYVIWGLASALQTTPPNAKQTLGGLVYHCWIEGEIFPDINGQQIVLTIPIHMLAGNVG